MEISKVKKSSNSPTPRKNSRAAVETDLIGLMHQISWHGRKLFVGTLERDQLDMGDWMILETLFEDFSEGTTMRQLSISIGMKPSSLTGVVDALVERGWIERQSSESDRRVVLVRLTQSGRDYVLVVRQHLHEVYQTSMAGSKVSELEFVKQFFATMLEGQISYVQALKSSV
jgi:DNA-binding MarR family transcriptional regulator